jgi:hypothetical protein
VQAVANYPNRETYPPVGSAFSPSIKRSKMLRIEALFLFCPHDGGPSTVVAHAIGASYYPDEPY